MNRILVTLAFFFALSPIAFSQSLDTAKLDAYFEALEANDKFMGSVAVARDGKIAYTKASGFIDLAEGIEADVNSKYRIGSISKTFTTVMILKAVERGDLNLEQSIEKYFPSIENAEQISLEDLLHHRSGIHNFTNDADYLAWNTEAKSEKQMLVRIAQGGSDFEPSTEAEYSNSNYLLLSYILEKDQGKAYAELLQEQIVKPLGLTNTYFGGPIKVKENESKSYYYNEGWKLQTETDMSIPLGAGGIVSTPSDLIQFSSALFGGKLLKEESLSLMKTMKDGYGMGLFQFPFNGQIGYGHTGGIDGFSSIFSYFPEGNVTYALISNGKSFNVNDISLTVLTALSGQAFSIPSFKEYELSSEDLDQYLGIYSSTQMPLKITISKDGGKLIAQASGQPSFPLQATEKDKFSFDQAGLRINFDPEKETLILLQGGGEYSFTKD